MLALITHLFELRLGASDYKPQVGGIIGASPNVGLNFPSDRELRRRRKRKSSTCLFIKAKQPEQRTGN